MSRFDYLIDKINSAPFQDAPFKHLYLENFFSAEDFDELIASPEIKFDEARDDGDLFDKLANAGYKIVPFPGCITDKNVYMDWHKNKGENRQIHTACEGFGITLRLFEPKTDVITELNDFLLSDAFNQALANKFKVDFADCKIDNGIQKYLDGYEISPHPDVRRKALTYMVNINPHAISEQFKHHTHYLKFKDDWKFVQDYWIDNLESERCWVPWDWCNTDKMQTNNNSIVIFSPSNNTMHGVKAEYDHLTTQRTQLYGNLWYNSDHKLKRHEWEDFVNPSRKASLADVRRVVVDALPTGMVRSLKGFVEKMQGSDVGKRDF